MQATPDVEDLELRHYLGALRRRKISVLATVAVLVAAAFAYSKLQTPAYRASAYVLLQGRPAEQVLASQKAGDDQAGGRGDIDSEIAVMSSQAVREEAERTLRQPVEVTVDRQRETAVVAVSASSRTPKEAVRIAQTYADTYISMRRKQFVDDLIDASGTIQAEVTAVDSQITPLDDQIRTLDAKILSTYDQTLRDQLKSQREQVVQRREGPLARRSELESELDQLRVASNLMKTGVAQLVSRAEEPKAPYKPQTRRSMLGAGALGLVLGVGIAFGRDHFDQRVRTRDDLERGASGLPVLSVIPTPPSQRDRPSTVLEGGKDAGSAAAEAYRRLRTSLHSAGLANAVRVLQVTSPNPEEGKTATVANLGVSLTRVGLRVVLVDANLGRPRLHEVLSVDNAQGLTSVLLDQVGLPAALQPVPHEAGLTVLPAGPPAADLSELLSRDATRKVFAALADEADVVLIDGPPLLTVTDATVLAGLADAVLLVARANVTTAASIASALDFLEQARAPVVGTVLAGVETRRNLRFRGRRDTYLDMGRYLQPGRARPDPLQRRPGPAGASGGDSPEPTLARGDDRPQQSAAVGNGPPHQSAGASEPRGAPGDDAGPPASAIPTWFVVSTAAPRSSGTRGTSR